MYTIPVAIALTVLLKPLLTRLDLYKICFLITVAVVYTIPWYRQLYHMSEARTDYPAGILTLSGPEYGVCIALSMRMVGANIGSLPAGCHYRTNSVGHPC